VELRIFAILPSNVPVFRCLACILPPSLHGVSWKILGRSKGHHRITFRFWPVRAPEVYTLEQKASSGASFASSREKCVWQYNFHSFTQSRRKRDTLASHPATLAGWPLSS
jgi:hypothetical protein